MPRGIEARIGSEFSPQMHSKIMEAAGRCGGTTREIWKERNEENEEWLDSVPDLTYHAIKICIHMRNQCIKEVISAAHAYRIAFGCTLRADEHCGLSKVILIVIQVTKGFVNINLVHPICHPIMYSRTEKEHGFQLLQTAFFDCCFPSGL